MRKGAALFSILCALAFASCSDDTESSPTPSPDFASAAREVAPSVPLAIADMPGDDWREVTEGEGDLVSQVSLPAECDIFDLNVSFPNAVTTTTGAALHGPDGVQVTSYAAIYRTPEEAQTAVDGTLEVLGRCEEDFKSGVKDVADDALSALGIHLGFLSSIDVTLEEQPQATGDGSKFYRLLTKVSVPGDDLEFTLDVRVVRSGRVIGAMTYYRQGEGDTEDEQVVTGALVDNASDGDGELPE